jgi:hypothetical protein
MFWNQIYSKDNLDEHFTYLITFIYDYEIWTLNKGTEVDWRQQRLNLRDSQEGTVYRTTEEI